MATLLSTTVAGSGSIILPKGTTDQRPSTPSQGDTRYNTEKQIVEIYNGSVWQSFPDIERNGLTMHWDPLDSYPGSGNTITDLSGNGRDGTLNSVGVVNTGGGYFEFNSQSDNISVSYTQPARQKTLQFWINTDRPLSGTDNWEIGWLNNTTTQGGMFGMMFGVGPTQDLGFWGYGSQYDLTIGKRTDANWLGNQGWVFVTAVMQYSRNVRVYRNDQQQLLYRNDNGSLAYTHPMATDNGDSFVVNSRGGWNSGMSRVWLGPVMTYERTLEDWEIVQNFYATKDRYGV